MSSEKLQVHIDGRIFALQPHGGITRCFVNILRCLQQRKDVSVTLYLPRHLRHNSPLSGFEVVCPPYMPRLRPGRLFASTNERLANSAIERMWSKPDRGVFHSTYYSTFDALKIPQVLTIQDMIYEVFPECFDKERHKKHVAEKLRCVKAAEVIVCPSICSEKDVRHFYSLKDRATEVIPYAIDPIFKRIKKESLLQAFRKKYTGGSPYLLYAGGRYAHKNFVGLLAAYSRWSGRKIYRLLAVGGGGATPEERSIIRGLGVSERIDFESALNEEELVSAYNAASAFIMPSMYEGFGFPILEAMACGTPVASSNGGSLPEVGQDVPVYFDAQDGEQLLDALENVIEIPRESERIEKGLQIAQARTWEKVTDEYVRLYHRIAIK